MTPTIEVPAEPTVFPIIAGKTALMVIDMQRDFLLPGGFGESLGNDVDQLLKVVPPLAALIAAARAAGVMVIHTREGHRPDLSDCPPAKLAALLPNLAEWGRGMIDNALSAAGTSAAEVTAKALNDAGVVYDGLKTLGEGAVLVGLILGTMVTFILDKKFRYAAGASAVGAALSFIGLIHAPEVAWAASPQVALGYLFFGIVCVAFSFLPGASDPVEVEDPDESGVVADH